MSELSELLSQEAKAEAPKRSVSARLLIGGLSLVIVVFFIIGQFALNERSREVVAAVERQVMVLADSRVEVVNGWLAGAAQTSGQLVNNDVFRLFATESALADGDDSLGRSLAVQAPYMMEALNELQRQYGLLGVHLVDADGRAILSAADAPPVSVDQAALGRRAVADDATRFASRQTGDGRFAVDLAEPVRPLPVSGSTGEEDGPPSAALAISIPVTGMLRSLLAEDALAGPGERTILVQHDGDGSATAIAFSGDGLQTVDAAALAVSGGPSPLGFDRRISVLDGTDVFSVGLPLPDLEWLVVEEIAVDDALADLSETRLALVTVGVLAALVIIAIIVVVWFHQRNAANRTIADQYRELAGRIDAQRRLLGGITGAMQELIGLKRPDGTYGYVNAAFADAVGRPIERIVGLDDAALFGHATAKRLALSDDRARQEGRTPPLEEQIYIGDELRHLEITKVAIVHDEPGQAEADFDGIVTVTRDVTDLVDQRHMREAAIRSMVDALVRTVELIDPYLAGHSRLVKEFGMLTAQGLGLGAAEIATIEIAANLCQIGKPKIPRDILTKPDRLTATEIDVMKKHIDHAASVLKGIDFGLPVQQAIHQMYERLDGSGYPQQIRGDQIDINARVLGVCDVFCARISPRSYRKAISADLAIRILADHPDKYDAKVVETLAESARSREGERLLNSASAAAD